MNLSGSIARHLRTNVVGYIALFVALSGTAIALPGKKAVKADDLAPAAVRPKAIKAGAVTTAKLRDGAVTSAKIADGSVIGVDLGNEAVGRDKIQAGAINGGKLANGAVNSPKVNNGSLKAEDFAAGELSAGFVAETDPATFTLPRGGSLFVNATLLTTCGGSCTYSVTVDGTNVPGTTVTTPAVTNEQLTLTGVTAALAAGDRTLDIVASGGGSVAEPTLAAVLLQ